MIQNTIQKQQFNSHKNFKVEYPKGIATTNKKVEDFKLKRP